MPSLTCCRATRPKARERLRAAAGAEGYSEEGGRVTVSGNNYNGAPNTNLALNVTYMSGTTGNTRALTDANHSAGANQGFIVTYNPATRVITVANKAAMTNTQSGEVFAEYFA